VPLARSQVTAAARQVAAIPEMQPRPAATPNPSIERTSSGTLRLPAAAAHVKR